MDMATSRLALGEVHAFLRLVAARRRTAARIISEIDDAQRRMNTLLCRRVPGELIDEIDDEIRALRAQLMTNEAEMMHLVEQSRRAN